MLCKTFNINKLKPGKYSVQEKFDGIRCFARVYPKVGKVDFFTRNGKPITTVDHLKDDLLNMAIPLAKNPGRNKPEVDSGDEEVVEIWFDGELFLTNFKETVSAVKRKEPNEKSKQVSFILFDYFVPKDDGIFSVPYEDRQGKLWSVTGYAKNDYLVFPPTITYFSWLPEEPIKCELIEEYLNSFLKDNPTWEGLIIKEDRSPYIFNKRSDYWLKLKKEKTADLTVVDVLEGNGKHEGRLGALIAANETGKQVKIGTGFTDKERDDIWKKQEEYKGKTVEISYMEKTEAGSYRFPVFKHFRFDK